jgi:hypothetical protein
MEQQRIGQDQMLEVVKGHLRKHQDAPDPVIAPVSGGSPPPPPPGAGAVAAMDVDRPAGKKREGMMMTGPTPMQPPAPKPRPPPVVTDMVPKALPSAQSFDISTPPPQRHRPPPAGLNVAPPLPAVPRLAPLQTLSLFKSSHSQLILLLLLQRLPLLPGSGRQPRPDLRKREVGRARRTSSCETKL